MVDHSGAGDWRVRDGWAGVFFFSSRRRHTRFDCDWSSDVCSSDLFERVGERAVSASVAGKRTHPGCSNFDEDGSIAPDRGDVRWCAGGESVGVRSRDGVKGERVSLERGEGEERFAVALAWAPPINLRLQDPGQPLGGPPPEDEVQRRREQQRPSVRQDGGVPRSEEHTSELQSQSNLVCRLLLEKKKHEKYQQSGRLLAAECCISLPQVERRREHTSGVDFYPFHTARQHAQPPRVPRELSRHQCD